MHQTKFEVNNDTDFATLTLLLNQHWTDFSWIMTLVLTAEIKLVALLIHFTMNLLLNNLYCIKRCINKSDLLKGQRVISALLGHMQKIWLFKKVFPNIYSSISWPNMFFFIIIIFIVHFQFFRQRQYNHRTEPDTYKKQNKKPLVRFKWAEDHITGHRQGRSKQIFA